MLGNQTTPHYTQVVFQKVKYLFGYFQKINLTILFQVTWADGNEGYGKHYFEYNHQLRASLRPQVDRQSELRGEEASLPFPKPQTISPAAHFLSIGMGKKVSDKRKRPLLCNLPETDVKLDSDRIVQQHFQCNDPCVVQYFAHNTKHKSQICITSPTKFVICVS